MCIKECFLFCVRGGICYESRTQGQQGAHSVTTTHGAEGILK